MKPPQEYIDVIDSFLASDHKAVQIPEANREDAACLRMVCYMKDLDVDILIRKGRVYLRKQNVAARD